MKKRLHENNVDFRCSEVIHMEREKKASFPRARARERERERDSDFPSP